ncbi:DoxX family protein [Gymnodinialimonas sp.]
MTALLTLHNRVFQGLETHVAPVLIPTLARFLFAAILFFYFWNSAVTKVGDGFLGLFQPGFGAYGQILPRVFEASGYDLSQIGFLPRALVLVATWGEFILPVLIVIGLATRIAAIGMIIFVAAQSWVDIFGHGLRTEDIGAWFDGIPSAIIMDQRGFWVFMLLVLVFRGAGPLSLDALLGRRRADTA